MKKLFFFSVLICASLNVSGATVDFEGIAPPNGFTTGTQTVGNFTFTGPTLYVLDSGYFNIGSERVDNGTDYIFLQSAQNPAIMTLTSPDPFSVTSFDSTEGSWNQTGPTTIVATGTTTGGGTVTQTFTTLTHAISNPNPPSTVAPFQNFIFDPTFTDLASLQLAFSNTGSSEFAMDNFIVNNVPIPAAAWLFASALLGLGVVKRRKA